VPEPSFIAPLVPRTAADERWHLRAELRDAANQAFLCAVPGFALAVFLLARGVPWLGLLIPLGLFFGGRKARANAERPRTGAAPGPLRSPAVPLPPTPYETRLCALLVAQDGRRQLNGLLVAGALLAFGDLLRLPLAVAAIPSSVMLFNNPLLVGLALGGCAASCGYWMILGSRYLAARAMVATEDVGTGAGRRQMRVVPQQDRRTDEYR